MIEHVPAARRERRSFGWLETHWLFSFDDYDDPANRSFGPLRVFNDDVVAPQSGFPLHGHREMEIVTIVYAGELTHADSLGNEVSLGPGGVQCMTAGRGIRHSEYNRGTAPVHFHQIWLEPRAAGLSPSFAHYTLDSSSDIGPFEPLVSGRGNVAAPLTCNADAVVYRCAVAAGARITRAPQGDVFWYVTTGEATVNGHSVAPGDQVRVRAEAALTVEARTATRGVWIELG